MPEQAATLATLKQEWQKEARDKSRSELFTLLGTIGFGALSALIGWLLFIHYRDNILLAGIGILGVYLIVYMYALVVSRKYQFTSQTVETFDWWQRLVEAETHSGRGSVLVIIDETLELAERETRLPWERNAILSSVASGAARQIAEGEWPNLKCKEVGLKALTLAQTHAQSLPVER